MKEDMLLELAERCEKAEGPDRELDAEIDALLGWRLVDNPTHAGGLVDLWHRPDGSTGRRMEPRSWTYSLDAALTLVPEGMQWCISKGTMATVATVGGTRDVEEVNSTAATPALALCAAALRARNHAGS